MDDKVITPPNYDLIKNLLHPPAEESPNFIKMGLDEMREKGKQKDQKAKKKSQEVADKLCASADGLRESITEALRLRVARYTAMVDPKPYHEVMKEYDLRLKTLPISVLALSHIYDYSSRRMTLADLTASLEYMKVVSVSNARLPTLASHFNDLFHTDVFSWNYETRCLDIREEEDEKPSQAPQP